MKGQADVELAWLRRLARHGWRWQLRFDPDDAGIVCCLSRGSGPPPYGQWVDGSAKTIPAAIRRAKALYHEYGFDRKEPRAEAIPGDARREAVRLLAGRDRTTPGRSARRTT